MKDIDYLGFGFFTMTKDPRIVRGLKRVDEFPVIARLPDLRDF